MKKIIINKQRKDGKFKVTYWYQGAENMFGGFEYPNVYNKLHSGEIWGHSKQVSENSTRLYVAIVVCDIVWAVRAMWF